VNVLAAIALAWAFQASASGLKIVTVNHGWVTRSLGFRDYTLLCVGNVSAIYVDSQGQFGVPSLHGPDPCPTTAKSAAVVTVDNPLIFKVALITLAATSLLQIPLVKRE
jgi:hypothetical protein